ncbi:MAG: phosphocholine cytidylyltransferase family protein [Ignavibacteria bacterium]|nr:phosphocholine cytidylyltransferase family protein [Ignavibacteria bacterium]
MQAIILAAGMSKRLRPLTDKQPKCLLKAGDKTLLEMTINNILKNNIKDFIMVTGYREDMIKDHIAEKFPELNVRYITNSNYENNNNSYSLWMTKNYISGDSILLDSDILFDYRIISKLFLSGKANCLAVKSTHKLGDEEIKVIIDSTNKINHIGKHLDPMSSYGESIGIERFSYDFFRKLGDILERKIVKENNVNEFYEASFQELYDQGNSMYAVDVSEYKCMEIDFPHDLEKAQGEVKFLEN